MSFKLSGHPQAVNIQIALCLDGRPGIFGGNILDKALSPDIALQKDKPLVQPFPQPILFLYDLNILLVCYGAADMFPVNIFIVIWIFHITIFS